MASTYSTTLRLELIGNGEQSGTWGDTTNNNLGTLLQDAITGVTDIIFANADYTMTANNGVADESRSAVLNLLGTNLATRNLIAPSVQKTYIVKNNTGRTVNIKTASTPGLAIPDGTTRIVWCNGAQFYMAASDLFVSAGTGIVVNTIDNFQQVELANTAVTAGSYTSANITVDAQGRLTSASSVSIGTIAAQNANNVAITGGTANLSSVNLSSMVLIGAFGNWEIRASQFSDLLAFVDVTSNSAMMTLTAPDGTLRCKGSIIPNAFP